VHIGMQTTPVEEKTLAETAALKPAQQAKPPVRGLASLATALGLGAVTAAAACCVLPLALASIGVGASLASGFAALADARTPLLVIGAAVLRWPGSCGGASARPRVGQAMPVRRLPAREGRSSF
jgi:hypothetical protein